MSNTKNQSEVIESNKPGKQKERSNNLYCINQEELSGQASQFIKLGIKCKNKK